MAHPWLGDIRCYRRLAAALGVYAVGSVYGLFALVEVVWRGQTWPLRPAVLGAVVLAMAGFGGVAYLTFLRLDGSGGSAAVDPERRIIPFP